MQTVARQTTGLRRANAATVGAPQRATVIRPLQVCRFKDDQSEGTTNKPWVPANVIETQDRRETEEGQKQASTLHKVANGTAKASASVAEKVQNAQQLFNGGNDQPTSPVPHKVGDIRSIGTPNVTPSHESDEGPTGTPHLGGVKVNPLIPAFTRRREVFAGRMAMLGLVAAGFWEWYFPSHPNAIYQVAGFGNLAGLNIGPAQAATFIFSLIAFKAAAALIPASPTWAKVNQEDVNKRPSPPADQSVSIFKRLGITNWGWTKEKEVFNGRMAMLGFFAMLINGLIIDGLSGPGVLGQIAMFLGKPADEIFYATVPTFVAFSAFASLFSVVTGNTASQKKELGDFEVW